MTKKRNDISAEVMQEWSRHLRKSGNKRIAKRVESRECGPCTTCCTVKSVAGMTEANVRCKNEIKGGCAIYKSRPNECRTYLCGWRMGLGGDALRPDRCGVMVELDGRRDGNGKEDTAIVIRVWKPYDPVPVADLINQASSIGFQYFGFIDSDTKQGEPYVWFSAAEDSGEIGAALALSARDGRCEWNARLGDATRTGLPID